MHLMEEDMKVTKDKFMGLEVYRVDHAPIAGRSFKEHPDWAYDHWYYHEATRNWERLGSDGFTEAEGREITDLYAHVPSADGSDYEEIVIEEDVPDTHERWGSAPLFRRVAWARQEVEEILAARAKD